ncbi:MAG TPA: hemerythrin domain-containing protein [Casimicrobiaceae bacterium]
MTTNRRKPSNSNDQPDALELLHAEHVELLEMFGRLCDADARHHRAAERKLASAACNALRRHSQIEWEFFYPALRAALGVDDDLLDAARIEHRTLDELVLELSNTDPRNSVYASKIDALAMYLAHHFREEEAKLFPKARASGLDLTALARRIAQRKAEFDD